ncbi:MAG: bifunctional DNA primase/polymerase [Ahniella sp.]|nr:bifunctional DNA primase/polymerase [Ahniella sp.]
MATGNGAPLRNPTGTSPLSEMELRNAVGKMLQGGIGPHLRLYPARYTSDELLLPMRGSWKGDEDVTNDSARAEELWSQYPGALVVCRCDCLVVFDVDLLPSPDGPRMDPNPWIDGLSAAQQEAMKTGLVAVTASGARHYIFRQREDPMFDSSFPVPSVDVKAGRGASLVLPPSFVTKHVKGYKGRHHWLDEGYNFEAPPVLPDALVSLLQELARVKKPSRKRRNRSTAADEKIVQGGRHTFLRDRAWQLRARGLGISELIGAVLATNQDRCDPPLPEDEARGLAESAFEKLSSGDANAEGATDCPVERNAICVNSRQLLEILRDSWRELIARNEPPRLFNHGGRLARLVADDLVPAISDLNHAAAYGELIRAADWVKVTETGKFSNATPPRAVADDMLVNVHHDLPRLESVVTTPVFDANWELICAPGYHSGARLWLHLPGDPHEFAIPVRPTVADLEAARTLLLDDLLVDFPFAADSDRAHAVAALLLTFVRRTFEGPTPIHLLEAPVPSSGKSLLADLITIVCIGEAANGTTLTKDENETRKKLTALLCRGRPIISIDNLDGGLSSAQLASAITTDRWDDRILGKTEMVTPPNRALWLASGNNPALSLEIARRCIRIRISPKEPQPWKRTLFKHPSIREWAYQNRVALVRAVLTIIRSWVCAGRPDGTQTRASFEPWSRTIGGIIEHLGLPGFLDDADEFYAAADSESGEWSALVAVWWEHHQGVPVGVGELLKLAEAHDLVAFACYGQSEQARKAKLGKSLSSLRGRKFGDLEVVITKNSNTKAREYRLQQTVAALFPIGEEAE